MDWENLIRELRAFGLTQEGIASAIGVTQPTISALATGKAKEPSFTVGDKLRALHKRMSRKATKSAGGAPELVTPSEVKEGA